RTDIQFRENTLTCKVTKPNLGNAKAPDNPPGGDCDDTLRAGEYDKAQPARLSWGLRGATTPACRRARADRPPARRRPARSGVRWNSNRAHRTLSKPPFAGTSGRQTAGSACNRAPADRS